jgi:alpha-beta hydrolase superfamily lysophospholipase
MMKETYSRKGWRVANADLPVYFISGADDPSMRGETAFHASAKYLVDHGYHNVTSALYEGMRHEILNEKEKMLVWNDIKDFIVNHPSFYHVP